MCGVSNTALLSQFETPLPDPAVVIGGDFSIEHIGLFAVDPIMVDWLTVVVPCSHKPLETGQVMSLSAGGEVEWLTEKAASVIGSYANHLQVRSAERNHERGFELCLSGNPVKWLGGHNVFGSAKLLVLVAAMVERLAEMGVCQPTEADWVKILRGDFKIQRVDLNRSWNLGSPEMVMEWLRSAEASTRLAHRGRGVFSGDTLYWGKTSRRWALKAYSKGLELSAADRSRKAYNPHRLPVELPHRAELLALSQGLLRIELVLRSQELRDTGLAIGSKWTAATPWTTFSNYLEKLEMSETKHTVNGEALASLSRAARASYELWESGKDPRVLMSKASFYRHRAEIKRVAGVDIATSSPVVELNSNVIPLRVSLEAKAFNPATFVVNHPELDWKPGRLGLLADFYLHARRTA